MRSLAPVALTCLLLTPVTALAKTVQAPTADGAHCALDVRGSGSHAAVLVHGQAGTPADWNDLIGDLNEAKIRTANVTLRPATTTPEGKLSRTAALHDVQCAITWLRAQGATHIALIGAELGANLAVQALAADDDVKGAVLISPHLNIEGVRVSKSLADATDQWTLLVTGAGNPAADRAASAMHERLGKRSERVELEVREDGTALMTSSPRLPGQIVGFVHRITAEQGPVGAPALTDAMHADDVDDIETTGTRYGETRRSD